MKIATFLTFISWVWDKVQLVDLQVVLHEVFHVERFEVTRQCLGSNRLDLLRLNFRLGHELEALVRLLVCCLTLKSMGLVSFQLYHR